ncbi:DUF262 domain-containing protein [Brachyspira intermedia]|uniref:DUF262 domain-containing protein n=1 Tax=Brachyspira intermedia TaxID=84377 RepID=UPI00300579DE
MTETTNQENDIIESVENIFYNGRIYNIPEYQRGYKWSEKDVNALLNDISNFQVNENDRDKFYCLQNITIKKQKGSENIYEVIDGQQRLTTLSILLSYLGETKLLKENHKYKIQYSIRDESQSFLYKLIEDAEKDYLNDKLEYINDFDRNYDSQDVFHFCLAKHTIIKFFGNDENKKEYFKKKLLYNVKLIVNDVSSGNDVKGETIFKNLNSNKVALEYYDLIRAIFITRIKKEDKETDIDLAEKRIKIGIDIDNMNIWWSDENVKEYFKMFSNENNISMLYDLYFKCDDKIKKNESESNNEALFKSLDNNTNEKEKILKEVIRFHNTMADWYEDKEIYHLLGFIGKHIKKIEIEKEKKDNIIYIWKKWENNTTKESFKNELKQIIKDDLIKNIEIKDNKKTSYENYLEYIANTNNNWYDYIKDDSIKLLILMDIIKIINNKYIKYKLPVNYFNKNKEDIEHIFSKTTNDKTTIKDSIENIELIIKSLEEYKEEKLVEYNDLITIKNKLKVENMDKTLYESNLLDEYINIINRLPYIHSIGNLVLLNSNTNRGYGNSSYIDKRRIIIEQHESGKRYIRYYTWSIFSKNIELKNNISVDTEKLDKWTIKDIEITAKYIKEKIKDFFNGIE